MAVDPVSFHLNQLEIDARIDTLIQSIQDKIDDIINLLKEDSISGYITISDGNHSEYNKKLKELQKDFKWYKNLAGTNKVFELKSAFALDYNNSSKECFILEKAEFINSY